MLETLVVVELCGNENARRAGKRGEGGFLCWADQSAIFYDDCALIGQVFLDGIK